MIYNAQSSHLALARLRGNGLGSLGQDLDSDTIDSIDFSPSDGSFSDASLDTSGWNESSAIDLSSGPGVDLTASTSLSSSAVSGSDSWFSSNPFGSLMSNLLGTAATAGTAIVTGAISTAALQQTNSQRLAQGLPPVNANGQTMTAAQMAAAGYNPTQVAAVQSQLAPETSTILLIGAIAVGAILLMGSKS